MNPSYGFIMWIIVGALAGWVASMIMKTNAKQGGLANIIIGVIGAVIGGFVTRVLFGDNFDNNGFIANFLIALLGSCALIGVVKAFSSRARGY